MKVILSSKYFTIALRLLLGGLFIIASISKILAPEQFVLTVINYGLIPDNLARVYGWIIPWLELFIGCSLLLGIFIRFVSILSQPLIITFMVASSFALVNGSATTCSCFGKFFSLSHPVSLSLDAIMILASWFLILNKTPEYLTVPNLLQAIIPKYRRISSVTHATVLMLLVAIVMVIIGLAGGVFSHKPTTDVTEIVEIPEPFYSQVKGFLAADQPAVIIVLLKGCPACETAKPAIAELEATYTKRVGFLHIDYAAYTPESKVMGITATPTVLIIIGTTPDNRFRLYRKYVANIPENVIQNDINQALQLVTK